MKCSNPPNLCDVLSSSTSAPDEVEADLRAGTSNSANGFVGDCARQIRILTLQRDDGYGIRDTLERCKHSRLRWSPLCGAYLRNGPTRLRHEQEHPIQEIESITKPIAKATEWPRQAHRQ